ncbi:hypothetical protein M9Y10_034792 [Tritrichomonas musculus]|uniref:CDT1 Geminin-binding domain-containing protein n=1 Tax=Tritrichomonas musculus TaxID=1915356 RepID=A0ABR2KFW9_9EUKA
MLFTALSKKSVKSNEDLNSSTSNYSSEFSDDSDISLFQPTQTVSSIKRISMPSTMVSSQTGVNIHALLHFLRKTANNQLTIQVKAANLIANSVVLRMMPILKNAINISKLRNMPISSDHTYISSLPTIHFAILDAEAHLLSRRRLFDCDESDPKILKFVEDISINNSTYPLCLPPEIKVFPEGIERIIPANEKKKEITVTDLLSVLNDDKMTDPYKLQSSFATAYIGRRKKK